MIALGHRADEVWDMTPRRIMAFLKLARRRRRLDAAERLSLDRLAAHGDPKGVEDAIRKLSRG